MATTLRVSVWRAGEPAAVNVTVMVQVRPAVTVAPQVSAVLAKPAAPPSTVMEPMLRAAPVSLLRVTMRVTTAPPEGAPPKSTGVGVKEMSLAATPVPLSMSCRGPGRPGRAGAEALFSPGPVTQMSRVTAEGPTTVGANCNRKSQVWAGSSWMPGLQMALPVAGLVPTAGICRKPPVIGVIWNGPLRTPPLLRTCTKWMPLAVPTFTLPKFRALVSLKSSTASPRKVPESSELTICPAPGAGPVSLTSSRANLVPSAGAARSDHRNVHLARRPGGQRPGRDRANRRW